MQSWHVLMEFHTQHFLGSDDLTHHIRFLWRGLQIPPMGPPLVVMIAVVAWLDVDVAIPWSCTTRSKL